MQTGAITGYIDVAQLTLYAFWIFFAGLVLYLRGEDRREGYPLVSPDAKGRPSKLGFPWLPKPKTFLLHDGTVVTAPRVEPVQIPAGRPTGAWPGAPLTPIGNPLIDGIGPASYARRVDKPDTMPETGEPRTVPLRSDPAFSVALEDADPRGMTVYGADGLRAGTVTDLWLDRSDIVIRFYEVEIGSAVLPHRVLMPMTAGVIDQARKAVRVDAILAGQFADVPVLKSPDTVTLLEEDKIVAYFGGGHLYAKPSRMGPLL